MAEIFDKLMRKLEAQHMDAAYELQKCFRESDKTYSEALNDCIAYLVAWVIRLQRNREKKREFLRDRFWGRERFAPTTEKLVLLTAMFMVGAKNSDSRRYDSALDYRKLVLRYLERDIDPTEVAACIVKEGGAHNIIRSLRLSKNQPPIPNDCLQVDEEGDENEEGEEGNVEGSDHDDGESDRSGNRSDQQDDQNEQKAAGDASFVGSAGSLPQTQAKKEREEEEKHRAKLMRAVKAIEARGMRALVVAVSPKSLAIANDVERPDRAELSLTIRRDPDWTDITGVLRYLEDE